MTIEDTISQLQSYILQLKEQAKSSGIDLSDDRNLTIQHEAIKQNLFLVLPHTQISTETERGAVGKNQEKNNKMSEKRRGRATRKEKKKQIRAKLREMLLPTF